jgi:hypothetical protein
VIIGLRGTHRRILNALVVFALLVLDLIDIILSVSDVIRIVGLLLPLLLVNSRHIVRLRFDWITLY